MNIERVRELRNMAAHIKANPLLDDKGEPIKFDMADWLQKTDTEIDGNHCGTAACLAGHMPFWPAFKNDGWRAHGNRVLRGREGVLDASEEYFGSNLIADRVFMGYDRMLRNVSIDDVIHRLDSILAGRTQFT